MPANAPPKTILIVDDDVDVVVSLEAGFRSEFPDYDIETASNGNKAVELWQKTKHLVVILDMMLPGRSGFLVLEKMRDRSLRQHPAHKSIIVMITGNQGPRHETYAMSLGADGYMLKPLKLPALFQVVRNKLAERAKHAP